MEEGTKDAGEKVERRIWRQHLATLTATLVAFSCGTVMGWSTPIVPYLQNDGANTFSVPITDEEASWLGSLSTIGAVIGAIPAGYVSDRIGRKKTLLILAAPLIISWIMFIFIENRFALLCVARIISGIGLGATMVAAPVYNEEVSDLKARGTTGTYCEIMLCFGIMFSFAVGAYTPYLWYNIICVSFDVIFLLTYIWMPESPMYLLMNERNDDAEKSLRWLRGAGKGKDIGIENELLAMKQFIEEERALKLTYGSSDSFLKRMKTIAKSFAFGTASSKALIISAGLLLFQQLNGCNAIMFYTVNLFEDAGTSISPYDASIIVGTVQLLAAYVSSRIIDFFGRKPLLLFSETCSCVLLTSIGVYFYYKDSGSDISSVAWVPVLILNLFTVTMEVGFGPTPWLVMAEVSPPETKGIITSSGGIIYWLSTFVVTKIYTNMVDLMGIAWTFWFFAICCVVGIFFIIFVVPETKMKTRDQIQHELRVKRKK